MTIYIGLTDELLDLWYIYKLMELICQELMGDSTLSEKIVMSKGNILEFWPHFWGFNVSFESWFFTVSGCWYTYPSEKYEFVSWDDDSPNIWKNKKCSKPPTSGFYCILWQFCELEAFLSICKKFQDGTRRSLAQTSDHQLAPSSTPGQIPMAPDFLNGNFRIQYMEVRVYHIFGHINCGDIPWNLGLNNRPKIMIGTNLGSWNSHW